MTINTSGSVGIGTTGPGSLLHVAGTGVLTLGNTGVTNGYINTTDSLYFNLDSNNNSTAERFVVATNRTADSGGTELFRIDENGNVGIGTTAPGKLVELYGASPVMKFRNSTNDTGTMGINFAHGSGPEKAAVLSKADGQAYGVTDLYFVTNANATNTNYDISTDTRMFIKSTGNVGIGDTSPAALLSVGSGDLFQVISTGEARGIAGTASAPSFSFTGATNAGMFNDVSNGQTAFARGGATIAGFDSNGLIMRVSGLTTGSAADLSVEGNMLNSYVKRSTSSARYKLRPVPITDWSWLLKLTPQISERTDAAEGRQFASFTAEEVASLGPKDKTGYPIYAALNEQGEPESVAYPHFVVPIVAAIKDHESRIQELDSRTRGLGTSGNGDLAISGNVGIGTTNPSSHTLQVTGSAGKTVGGTAWADLSDARLKNVQGEIKGTALDTLMQLRPIKFKWNDTRQQLYGGSTDNLMYGFVAQEIMQVIPEFVKQGGDGYYWYNPSGFEAILTAGVQELNTKFTALQSQFGAFNGVLSGPAGVGEQCVTGDTRLRRRRRKKDGSYVYDEVCITDLEVGDEVLSLGRQDNVGPGTNSTNGNFGMGTLEFHEVKALLFMGIQEVFELTTKSGRKIKTTSKHPYLTLNS
ncbi:MAG: hypothetical protein UW57_C0014G0002 [Candidatus Giovannonibacteria bacterium GW2011_GWA1_44_29]|uniref:Peptidase S74 domain-containing protein n=1 Tax=Candidatus Giovannonibacteria bacterium GW2011_GWA1_44_29 TaxID=1618646 RepID=A0A0G1IUL0_9BACT|nr:MAG: hypothetical protein UW57_C0014G0002 [Candidatus Giovannonibacteria bacterium GW2011_GWA1_44_29]